MRNDFSIKATNHFITDKYKNVVVVASFDAIVVVVKLNIKRQKVDV